MANIAFGTDGKADFPTKYHGYVTLSSTKWAIICGKPERSFYQFNGEKIATTLISPDQVRHHAKEPTQLFYYKRFTSLQLSAGVETPCPQGVWYAVIIDTATGRICTVYPVPTPKPGKAYVPPKSK